VRAAWGVLEAHFAPALAAKAVTVEQIRLAFLLGSAALSPSIVAVSVGAVFFGANTYIGNGPNFMVKAIADQKRVRTPSFLGYVFGFTLPYMVPMLALVWWLFFRG
jgi:Na+/H+ antiporter NhaD/arsenite permease-like protein